MPQASILKWWTALAGIVFLMLASSVDAEATSPLRQQQTLKTGWMIKQLNGESHDVSALTAAACHPDETWLRTDMPNQVADVLLHYDRIPDPHVGKNAAACAWIWMQDWAYATTFVTPPSTNDELRATAERVVVWLNGLDQHLTHHRPPRRKPSK